MNFSTSRGYPWKETFTIFIGRYKHALLLMYMCIYFPWFNYLEKHVTTRFHVIHTALDDKIPFLEFFVVPYFLWFFYVAFAVLYFLLKNKEEYFKLCTFLFVGMTVFLVISTIYPNGHYLRPATFERNNIFTALVAYLYKIDTPTNLFPSIHVYNSIGVNIALWHCDDFKKNKPIRIGSAVMMISIVLSTMFLKQHSVFDVITGIAFAACMYTLVYTKNNVHIDSPEASLAKWVGHV
ncbi:MAG: phosphatase PAP2 family protein [Roseburia sp.]|nr:phosphatase PAP2 family protein [Roseburia sp.]